MIDMHKCVGDTEYHYHHFNTVIYWGIYYLDLPHNYL